MTFQLNIKTAEDLQNESNKLAKDKRVAEIKAFLRETDYVALPDYDKENVDILAGRQAARDEIRDILGGA